MVEHIRRRLMKDIKSPIHAATKIRHKYFDLRLRIGAANCLYTGNKMPRPAVTQVIPVD